MNGELVIIGGGVGWHGLCLRGLRYTDGGGQIRLVEYWKDQWVHGLEVS